MHLLWNQLIFRVSVVGSLSECAQWNVMVAPALQPRLPWCRHLTWPSPGSLISATPLTPQSSVLSPHPPQLACWSAAVSAGISCYPSAQFRLLLDVPQRVRVRVSVSVAVCASGLHCMSHVALELKTQTKTRTPAPTRTPTRCVSPRRPSDKVLSYDLLKCPNAAITRDYYKCIRRVQRIRMHHKKSHPPAGPLQEHRGTGRDWWPGNRQQIVLAAN